MGILLRKSNFIRDVYQNPLESDVSMMPPSDSSKDSASLAQFLNDRHLISTDETTGMERARDRVEASGIVNTMTETCATINGMAGRTIVDMHSFVPPEPIFCCFIFAEDGTEYFMRLELQGTIPTLSFSERKCRDTVSNDFVRWVHRLADIEPVTITIKLVHEFQEVHASAYQVREWFKYLISGLDRNYIPSFK
jgi:hypothetical protein